jgi:glyoxylase-like metal-dependent hydrolase (beta-lactamase superfamily II)
MARRQTRTPTVGDLIVTRPTHFAFCSAVLLSAAALAQTPPAEVTLTRLDCGSSAGPVDIARFSDTYAYEGRKQPFTASCYLVRHGDDYLMWDTGYPTASAGAQPSGPTVKVSLVEQLAKLEVKPEQIGFVGISHYHGDHIGQAASFPQATLLIGKGDWDALTSMPPLQGANPAPVTHWISGGGKLEVVPRDKDVFGDGSVVMLDTPGHTPGHHSLLLRLKEKGPVLLTGDLAHFRENYESNGVPSFNTNRADTLASLERFKGVAKNTNATVIIQHDPRDIEKLPAFPAAAR